MPSLLEKRLGTWRVWAAQSVNRKIFDAALIVFGLSLVVKGVAVLKDLVVANQFGLDDSVDAFLIAFMLPAFAVNVLAGSFSSAFLPTYIRVRTEYGHKASHRLFGSLLFWGTGLLLTVIILLWLFGPSLLLLFASGFEPTKLALTLSLYNVLLPVLLFDGLLRILTTLLNADDEFAFAAISPVVRPLMALMMLLFFREELGIFALAWGMTIGTSLSALLVGWRVAQKGFSLIPSEYRITPAFRQVGKQYIPMIAGAFLMSGTLVVDQTMATMLAPGSVASLEYGNKVIALVLGLAASALGTALLPHYSRLVVQKDWSALIHTLKTYSGLILGSTLPVVIILYTYSDFVVTFVFQRGAFTSANAATVSSIQSIYALNMPAYLLGILFVRLVSALNMNWLLLVTAVINLFLNVLLNFVFMRIIGIAGIALSTVIVSIFSSSFILLVLYSKFRRYNRDTASKSN